MKQTGIKDCAAASLLMIIQYYHGNLPLDKVELLCKTTKRGTSAYHLIKAAEQIGFEAKGMHCTKERLYEGNILLPAIIYVTVNQSYNHYVVLYEMDMRHGYLMIADPADKIKKMRFAEFDKIYNETIVLLKPERLIPYEEKETTLLTLFKYLIKKYKRECIYYIGLSLFFSLFSILTSFYLKYMVDAMRREASISYTFFIFLLFLFFIFLQTFSFYLRNQILLLLNQKIDFVFTTETISSILSLPYPYYHTHTTGEMLSKLEHSTHVKENIGVCLGTLFVDLPLSFISFIILFFMHHSLSFLVLSFSVIHLFLGCIFYKTFKKWIYKFHSKNEVVQNFLTEAMKGFETIQGLHIQKNILKTFKHHYLHLLYAREGLYRQNNLFLSFLSFLEKGCDLCILFLGTFYIGKGMALGNLLSFLSLTTYFLYPFKSFSEKLVSIEEAITSIKRISGLFMKEEENGYLEVVESGKLCANQLTYTYDDREDILEKISFTIEKGTKALLLGKSGLGKSTILKLFMKYYPIERGMLYRGEGDLSDYKKIPYQKNILYVSQNEILFTDTLYHNLTLWEEVEEKKIQKVIQICALEEVIGRSKLGLFMMVEENGSNFSGGERQRIILARALLKKFNILFIDEGFSEMDTILEKQILQNIFRYFPMQTILVVSHHHKNVDLFDQVLRFDARDKVLDIRKMPNGKYMVYH